MGLSRFFAANLAQGSMELEESESHHAARVLRLQVGDDILLFDGRGHEGFGTIRSIDRRRVGVDVASIRFAPRDHDGQLTLAVGMPKGDRQRSVIEKLVELGVDCLVPIETEHTVARIDSDAHQRLERYMIEACKQSMRNRFLDIRPSVRWYELVRDLSWQSHRRWVLHPKGSGAPAQPLYGPISNAPILFAVGPEGGFTEQEIRTAHEAGFQSLDLGERVLRVETAVAYASILGDLMTALGTTSTRCVDTPTHP